MPIFAASPSYGGIIFGIVFLILFLWSLDWLYKDAQKRTKAGCVITLLVAFFAWPFGLLIWLFARPTLPDGQKKVSDDHSMSCPRCGHTIPPKKMNCPYCNYLRGEDL